MHTCCSKSTVFCDVQQAAKACRWAMLKLTLKGTAMGLTGRERGVKRNWRHWETAVLVSKNAKKERKLGSHKKGATRHEWFHHRLDSNSRLSFSIYVFVLEEVAQPFRSSVSSFVKQRCSRALCTGILMRIKDESILAQSQAHSVCSIRKLGFWVTIIFFSLILQVTKMV